MAVESFEDLEVWQKAHALALMVYKATSKLPEEEEFGLILQMRRAATEVPANIANGFSRRMLVAKLSLYRDARAAVEELRYYFVLCRDLGYEINFEEMATQGEQLARMVGGLVGSIARRDHGQDRRGRGPGRDRGGRGERGDRGEHGDRGPRGEHGENADRGEPGPGPDQPSHDEME